jgi:hypothetical protein
MTAYIDFLEKELEKIQEQAIKMSGTFPNIDLLVPRIPLNEIRKCRFKSQVEIIDIKKPIK